MKLYFKQRFFSWFDSYDIYNEAGETVYTVEGKAAYAVGVIGMFRSPHSEEFHAAVEQVCVTASMISTALGYRKQEETL